MVLTDINDRRLKQYLAGEITLDQLAAGMRGPEPYEIVNGEVRVILPEEYRRRIVDARSRVPGGPNCPYAKVRARYEAARPDIEANGPPPLREIMHETDKLLARMTDWSDCQRAARLRTVLTMWDVNRGHVSARPATVVLPETLPTNWPLPAFAASQEISSLVPTMPPVWASGGDIDLVVPLGTGSQHDDVELSCLLRSAAVNVCGLRTAHVIGVRRPAWLTDHPRVRWHQLPQAHPKNHDIIERFLYAARHPDVSELFIASCDDWLFIRPVDMLADMPAMQFGGVLTTDTDNSWHRSCAETRRLLEGAGKPVRWYDYHVPTVMSKAGWLQVDREVPWRSVDGHAVWSLYHNVVGVHGSGEACTGGWAHGWHGGTAPETVDAIKAALGKATFTSYNDTGLNATMKAWLSTEPWKGNAPRKPGKVGRGVRPDAEGPWTPERLGRLAHTLRITLPEASGYQERLEALAAKTEAGRTPWPDAHTVTFGPIAGGHLGDVLCASALPRLLAQQGHVVYCEDNKVMRAVFEGNPFVAGFNNGYPRWAPDFRKLGHRGHVAQHLAWQVDEPCDLHPRGEVYLSEEEVAWARAERAKLPADRPMIVVSTGCVSSQLAYAGPLDWQGVIDELSEDCSVVCPVVTQEAALPGKVNERWRKSDFVPLRCQVYENLPVRRFMALVAVADGALGTMGGTMHVAAATETPYVCVLPYHRPPEWSLRFPVLGRHGDADARWLYPQHTFAYPTDRPAWFPYGWMDVKARALNPADQNWSNVELVGQCLNPAEKYLIAREYAPRRIVEIGVRYGYSTLGLLLAAPGARYLGFDIISPGKGADGGRGSGEDTFPYVQASLARNVGSGLHVTFTHQNTQTMDVFPEADFYHIGGDHSYVGAYRDMEKALQACAPGGVLVVDDYYHLSEVRRACDTFALNHAADIAQTRILPTWRGDFVIVKRGPVRGRRLNVHWMTTNCGDHNAAVLKYFPGYAESPVDLDAVTCKVAVYGGGGLYTRGVFQRITRAKAKGVKVVLWGVGVPTEERAKGMTPDAFRALGDAVDLAGLREPSPWGLVPCPSCMNPLFDLYQSATPVHKTVYYDHPAKSVGPGEPRMTNFDTTDLARVLAFLASGEKVVTSSYHGIVWATWLGRRVEVRGPAANQLTLSGPWLPLADARRLNVDFARKVESLTATDPE